MQKPGLKTLALLAVLLFVVSGCVELTGQRISWFYDAAKDELRILICYDGVHDSGEGNTRGSEQIPKFVEAGDVMLLDWPLHFDMVSLRQVTENEDASAEEKDSARLITSIQTKPIGFYREPDGRIGAAQLVTIPHAKDFVGKVNALISREVLKHQVDPKWPLARTLQRMQAAARDGHQWIALDGQAIRASMPVHPGEWARAKGEFFDGLAREMAEGFGVQADQEKKDSVKMLFSALASAPVSYIDHGNHVELVLGQSSAPSTLRFYVRDEYEPNLDKVLAETVKVDLDETLAAALLDEKTPRTAELAAVLEFGPPEDRARALIAAAEKDPDGPQAQAAIEQLASWGTAWNQQRGVPEAPAKTDNRQEYLSAWKGWYQQIKQCPILKQQQEAAQGEN